MSGRPVQRLAAAALAAVAGATITTAASANCYSCGSSYSYAAPVAVYTPPVVYSYSVSAPVSYGYASGCSPCGGGYSYGQSYGYAAAPTYVVNQGPTYSQPVTIGVEPTQPYDYGYRRAYPYYGGGGGLRWHHRRWNGHHGYGYRQDFGGYRQGYGYRQNFGHRRGWGHRHQSLRYGIAVPGFRAGWQGRYRTGLIVPKQRWGGGAIPPRHWNAAVRPHRMGGMPPHRAGGGQMHIMRQPGVVHPQGGMKKMP